MGLTRCTQLAGLIGVAATGVRSHIAGAADEPPNPPEGIDRRIRHLSYSDQGGVRTGSR